MEEQAKASEGITRWWEFYAVRYAMGTVVGAIVFYFLCSKTPTLKPLLFGSDSDTATLDTVRLTLLAVYGLIYCYIASAPILVFHAARFLIEVKASIWVWIFRILPFLVLSLIPLSFVAYKLGFLNHLFYGLAVFLVLLVIALQYIAIGLALENDKAMFKFYEKLAINRAQAKGGIIDSYRHLREHGNSFFIVLLEILLGIVLIGAGKAASAVLGTTPAASSGLLLFYLSILIIWILPSVLVWLAGTVFERNFALKVNSNAPEKL